MPPLLQRPLPGTVPKHSGLPCNMAQDRNISRQDRLQVRGHRGPTARVSTIVTSVYQLSANHTVAEAVVCLVSLGHGALQRTRLVIIQVRPHGFVTGPTPSSPVRGRAAAVDPHTRQALVKRGRRKAAASRRAWVRGFTDPVAVIRPPTPAQRLPPPSSPLLGEEGPQPTAPEVGSARADPENARRNMAANFSSASAQGRPDPAALPPVQGRRQLKVDLRAILSRPRCHWPTAMQAGHSQHHSQKDRVPGRAAHGSCHGLRNRR